MRNNPQHGFTILELLVILGLASIIGTLAFGSLMNALASNEVRQAATQLKVDLEKARGQAQRRNLDTTVTFTNTGYTVSQTGNTWSRATPNGMSFVQANGTAAPAVTYTAPFGEIASNPELKVSKSSSVLYLKLIGTTGKAVISAKE